MLFQRSRPHLFSNALPPTVARSALEAVRVLRREPELVERLHTITARFREQLREIGYSPLDGEGAIIPIIVGETAFAIEMSQRLLDEGIFVTGFGFPVVPEGTARIRVQMSAALEDEHLERALEAFERVGKQLGVI
jgi:glycine C-acetyltransferase